MLLHNNNAPAHSGRRTIEYLSIDGVSGVTLMRLPSYNSDLAICYFYLLSKIKNKFGDLLFYEP